MSWKRAISKCLDRSGGRWLLSWAATAAARRVYGSGVSVFHDRIWAHTYDDITFPDGPQFQYSKRQFAEWACEAKRCRSEAHDYWFQQYKPGTGDVVVDVGAGRGEDVFAFAEAVGPTGKVLAIEAHPVTFEFLSHFCRLNRLTQVIPVNVAVMDQPGSVTISDGLEWQDNTVSRETGGGLEVPGETLSGVCSRFGIDRIDLLKMNIEGAERVALAGFGEIADRVRAVCIACHDFRADLGHGEWYRTRVSTEEVLTRHGFTLQLRADDPREYVRDHLFAMKG